MKKSAKLEKLIFELNVIVQSSKKNSEGLSHIDIDLALDKTRKIYDLLLQYKAGDVSEKFSKLLKSDENEAAIKSSSLVEDEIQAMETQDEDIQLDELLINSDTKSVASKAPLDEYIQEGNEIEFEVSKPVSREPKPEKIKIINEENPDEPATEQDLFSMNSGSADVSNNDAVETIAERIQKKQVTKLVEVIGINEKFFFLNELFDGELSQYNQAISAIDEPNDLDSAMKVLNNFKLQNNWDVENTAFGQLQDLLEKKFS